MTSVQAGAVALLLCSAAARAEDRYALVIGSNLGWAHDVPLRFAEDDAARVRDALVQLGDFPADRVSLLLDPDTAQVRARVRRLGETFRAAGGRPLLFVFYAGHADGKLLHLRGAPLAIDDWLADLRALPASSLLALSLQGPGARAAPGGFAGACASNDAEAFAAAWAAALRGAADLNCDGRIDFDEACPGAPSAAAVALTMPSRAGAGLVLPPGSERFAVLDERQTRVLADARASRRCPAALGLSPGDYVVDRVGPSAVERAELTLAAGARVPAAGLAYEPAPRTAELARGSPDERDPAAVRAWRRGEGLRLLAAGDFAAARGLFEALFASDPKDLPSQRGKARALVRLGEAADAAGKGEDARALLAAAVEADPTLKEDPDFAPSYQRLTRLAADVERDRELAARIQAEKDENPRAQRTWGLGFDLISTRGALAPWASAVLWRGRLFPSLGVDLFGFGGIGAEVRFVPTPWRLSPFVSAGGHVTWRGTGLFGDWRTGQGNDYFEVWSRMAHVDVGMEYFGSLGFMLSLGAGFMVYESYAGQLAWSAAPNFSFAWFFPLSAATR